MPSSTMTFLSSVSQSSETLTQEGNQARLHHDAVEIIASHADEILAQAIKGQTSETPKIKEIAENILRYVTYSLFLEDTSAFDNYLATLRETYIDRRISIYSIKQTIPLIKDAAIQCIKQYHSDNNSALLLAAYFDFSISALDGCSDDMRELMDELNLTTGSTGRLESLLERLSGLLDRSKQYVRIWLTSPHPDFGGKTPIFYLQQNKIEVVENLVEAIETGQIG